MTKYDQLVGNRTAAFIC